MKLYYYSNEFVTVKEAKWIVIQFFVYGIVLGSAIFFGLMMVDQSVDHVFVSRLENALVTENNILHQQLNQLAPQVILLEKQKRELYERGGVLQILLNSRSIDGDSIPLLTIAGKKLKNQLLTSSMVTSKY